MNGVGVVMVKALEAKHGGVGGEVELCGTTTVKDEVEMKKTKKTWSRNGEEEEQNMRREDNRSMNMNTPTMNNVGVVTMRDGGAAKCE